MRELLLRLTRRAIVSTGFLLAAIPIGLAQSDASTRDRSLKSYLRDYVKQQRLPEDNTTRYVQAYFDLDHDGQLEAIVYLEGRWWCGSGGCPTLILTPSGSTYKEITRVLITRPPIRVLDRISNGWHDIGVWVQGGGIQPGYEADLQFDGKGYPSNPSTPPSVPTGRRLVGTTVITADQDAIPLSP